MAFLSRCIGRNGNREATARAGFRHIAEVALLAALMLREPVEARSSITGVVAGFMGVTLDISSLTGQARLWKTG